MKYVIAVYDMEDNNIGVYESYKECAEMYNLTAKQVRDITKRIRLGLANTGKLGNKYVRIYKYNMEE